MKANPGFQYLSEQILPSDSDSGSKIIYGGTNGDHTCGNTGTSHPDLAFVDQFYDKLYTLDDSKLSAEQKVALHLTLEKMRSMIYQKMKGLK